MAPLALTSRLLRARPRAASTTTLAAASFLLALTGCATTPKPVKLARTIEPGPVQAVDVGLSMSAGTLQVNGGSCSLVQTDIEYDADRSDTRMRYSVREGRGELVIEERRSSRVGKRTPETRWSLCFGPETPLHMRVNVGAGNGALNVGQLDLRSLELDFGAGNAELDLRGDFRTNLRVEVAGGAGNISLRVPRNVGVRVQADKGVGNVTAPGFRREDGSYTNAAYGSTPRAIEIYVEVGVGNINIVES